MGFLNRLLGRGLTPPGLPHATDPTDAPLPQAPLVSQPPDRIYRVRQGDTLPGIAREVYGDEAQWPRIAEANRQRVGDPPVLYPGLVLELP